MVFVYSSKQVVESIFYVLYFFNFIYCICRYRCFVIHIHHFFCKHINRFNNFSRKYAHNNKSNCQGGHKGCKHSRRHHLRICLHIFIFQKSHYNNIFCFICRIGIGFLNFFFIFFKVKRIYSNIFPLKVGVIVYLRIIFRKNCKLQHAYIARIQALKEFLYIFS